MEAVINKMKKIPHVDPNTGNYNLKFNLNNMLEDYYLPVRGGQSSTAIDTLPGMTFTGIDDINYVKDKMMAALKIPKPFLGYAEAVEGKTTSLGAAFAVNKELTIGLIHSKTSADGTKTTERSATSVPDEKLKAINIGYNLGPVVANAVLVDSENVGGVAGTDPRVFFVNLTTKF
jgi:hypothetical protein